MEPEFGEVGEVAELCGYVACELVAVEMDVGESTVEGVQRNLIAILVPNREYLINVEGVG